MAAGVPILIQQHTLPQALMQGNALVQSMMQTQAMPEQIRNSLALQRAQSQIAGNQAAYGGGSFGDILTALNNPNVTDDQKTALNNALLMNSLYRPGMPNDLITQGLRTAAISGNPSTSDAVQAATGQTPQELNQKQQQQYQSKTAKQQAEAKKDIQQGNYYQAGGAQGTFLDNLLNGTYGKVDPSMVQQAVVAKTLQGATPEVKRNYAYQAAQGDPTLQSSIQGANLKATSNQQLLKQQQAFETFDAAAMPFLQKIAPAVAYYSGPQGAIRLQADRLNQIRGNASPQYQAYVTSLQTDIPLLADNARKILGAQASDAMNTQLQGIVGPGDKADMKSLAMMPPEVVYQKINDFRNYLQTEAAKGREFVGPTSMEKITAYRNYPANDVQKLMKATGMNFDQAKAYIDEQLGQ